jgi:hypothetical protein
MSNTRGPDGEAGQPVKMVYQIRIKGHLSPQWADQLPGFSIILEDNGDTPYWTNRGSGSAAWNIEEGARPRGTIAFR